MSKELSKPALSGEALQKKLDRDYFIERFIKTHKNDVPYMNELILRGSGAVTPYPLAKALEIAAVGPGVQRGFFRKGTTTYDRLEPLIRIDNALIGARMDRLSPRDFAEVDDFGKSALGLVAVKDFDALNVFHALWDPEKTGTPETWFTADDLMQPYEKSGDSLLTHFLHESHKIYRDHKKEVLNKLLDPRFFVNSEGGLENVRIIADELEGLLLDDNQKNDVIAPYADKIRKNSGLNMAFLKVAQEQAKEGLARLKGLEDRNVLVKSYVNGVRLKLPELERLDSELEEEFAKMLDEPDADGAVS